MLNIYETGYKTPFDERLKSATKIIVYESNTPQENSWYSYSILRKNVRDEMFCFVFSVKTSHFACYRSQMNAYIFRIFFSLTWNQTLLLDLPLAPTLNGFKMQAKCFLLGFMFSFIDIFARTRVLIEFNNFVFIYNPCFQDF